MSVIHVAANQLTLIMRSKWLAACSFVFVALAFLVTYFTPTGGAGYGGFNRMTASMLNITLFVIPLIALLLGALFLAGEKEDGGLHLLLTYPVSRASLILGKFLGFCLLWELCWPAAAQFLSGGRLYQRTGFTGGHYQVLFAGFFVGGHVFGRRRFGGNLGANEVAGIGGKFGALGVYGHLL